MGLTKYYRLFVKGYLTIIIPPYKAYSERERNRVNISSLISIRIAKEGLYGNTSSNYVQSKKN